jgi:hypothetical protein
MLTVKLIFLTNLRGCDIMGISMILINHNCFYLSFIGIYIHSDTEKNVSVMNS